MVRPWLKRVALWSIPTLLLMLAWQAWDRVELERLRQAVDALAADASTPAPQGDDSGWRLYMAADVLIEVPATIYPVLASLRHSMAFDRQPDERAMTFAAQFVEKNRQGLELATDAAEQPWPWKTDASQNASDAFRSRRIENAYAIAILHAIAEDRLDDAAAAAADRAMLLRVFAREPNVLNVLFKADAIAVLSRDIALLLGRRLPIARLDALDGALSNVLGDGEIERAIRAEAQWRHRTTTALLGAQAVSSPLSVHPMRPLWWRRAAETQRTAAQCITAARRPWPEPLSNMPRVGGEPETGALSALIDPRTLVDLCHRATLALAQSLATIRATQLAIRVERGRLTGTEISAAVAESLDQATASAVDPYTAEPLRYRAFADGYAVYAVGADAKDDGGDVDMPATPGVSQSVRVDPGKDVGVRVRIRPPVR